MKHLLFAVSLFLVAGGANSIAAGNAVVPGQQRLDALEKARELIAPRAPTWRETTEGLPDPFFRSNQARASEKADSEPVAPAELTDRELLQKLALQIEPSGHFVVGGEPVLLVNGRRLRAGDSVTLNFEGRVYQVAISSIESNSFTLQLKQQELRRELK
jgi:hypothetical protein